LAQEQANSRTRGENDVRIDFYGLTFETPRVTFYLWSPWRASAIEHRLFEAVSKVPKVETETGPDERRVHITDPKSLRAAVQVIARVLKGWQEEADQGSERRSWRWLLEGDSDADGYDHTGELACLWGFLRLGLEHGGPSDGEKREDLDMEGFGMRIWGATGERK
jgi:hypothetical protein